MASFWFEEGMRRVMVAYKDLSAAPATTDINVLLCGNSSTTVDERTTTIISSFGTLDEYVGTNYTAGGKALGTKTVSIVATNISMFDAVDLTWGSLGADAGGNMLGALVYFEVTAPPSHTDGIPLCYIDFASSNVNGNDNDFKLQFHAKGICHIQG